MRNAIAELLERSERHCWSLNEIAAELSASGTSADFSSVYRAVEALIAEGVVHRFDLGSDGARFEAVGARHEHIRCERCGAVVGIPGQLLEEALPQVERVTGYVVSGYELLFRGLCPACADAAPEQDSR